MPRLIIREANACRSEWNVTPRDPGFGRRALEPAAGRVAMHKRLPVLRREHQILIG
jgi:hypothetical protein